MSNYTIPKIEISPELIKALESVTSMQQVVPEGMLSLADSFKSCFENMPNIQFDSMKVALEGIEKPSEELEAIRKAIASNDAFLSCQKLFESINMQNYCAQNFAFAKMLSDSLAQLKLPYGSAAIGKSLSKSSINKMLNDTELKYDSSQKGFYYEDTEIVISPVETNIVYSAEELFNDISAKELTDLISYTIDCPEYASKHPIGIKIHNKIKSIKKFAKLDADFYYHARTLEKGKMPYTYQELSKAPHGISGQGRFNHLGRSHYYFSDTQEGAVSEVRKHMKKDAQIQVAKIRIKQNARLFDISEEIKNKSPFLDYCRYAPDYDNIPNCPREYVLPCFLASTCKALNIDGIKYYGNKSSNNYVTWNDNYFEVVDSTIV